QNDPYSLHKYLYAHADPVNRIDPSGNADFTAIGQLVVTFVQGTIRSGGALANSIAYGRISFTLYKAYTAAESFLFYAEVAGVTIGALGVIAQGMDSMAERL